jgi:hypothetical protein
MSRSRVPAVTRTVFCVMERLGWEGDAQRAPSEGKGRALGEAEAVSPRTVGRWARDGLPWVRTVGGHRRFRWADVRAWIIDSERDRAWLERCGARCTARDTSGPTSPTAIPVTHRLGPAPGGCSSRGSGWRFRMLNRYH